MSELSAPKFLIAFNEGYNERRDENAFFVIHTQNPAYVAKVTRNSQDFEQSENKFKLPWGKVFYKIEIVKFLNENKEFSPNALLKFVKTTLIKNAQK